MPILTAIETALFLSLVGNLAWMVIVDEVGRRRGGASASCPDVSAFHAVAKVKKRSGS